MSNGLIISISSNYDDDENDKDDSIPPSCIPQGNNVVPYMSPFPKNTQQKNISIFLKNNKGRKRIFHKPNAALTRRGNEIGKGIDNGK